MTENRNSKYYKQSRWTYPYSKERAVASDSSSYKTDLSTSTEEDAVLELIGYYLFGFLLSDWKDCKAGVSAAERKAKMRPFIGDRYAYAIVRRNNDQLALQKRNIEADRKLKEAENKAFEKRIEQAAKWREKHPDLLAPSGKKPTKKQYDPLTYEEWGRYQHNKAVLARYDLDDYVGVTFGGKKDQRIAVRAIRNDPESEEAKAKHRTWKLSRYEIKAIGDSTHACGNSVVQLNAEGRVRVLVPDAICEEAVEKLGRPLEGGKYLVLGEKAVFHYGWDVLLANIEAKKSVTSSITFEDGSWRLTSTANSGSDVNRVASDAASGGGSIAVTENKQSFALGKGNPAIVARNAVKQVKSELKKDTVSSTTHRANVCNEKDRQRFLGIDVNDGHIDLCVCDIHGNPCGQAMTLEFRTDGTSEQIKSSVLHALCCVRYIAERRHVSCVFIEKLKGFLDCKSKALNRGSRAFRRSVHRIPCGELKEWIVRKLTFDGCHVEFVPAAYTSKCAEEYWSDIFSSSHQAAALMIARRGLGLGLFRRTPASPRLSCVIDAERSSDSRDSSASMVDGGRARIGSDCGEEPGQPGDDIRGASVSDGTFLRKLRRTHRLSAPVGGVVPR